MWLVAAHARLGAVYRYRRERSLLLGVASLAISRLVRFHTQAAIRRPSVNGHTRRLFLECFFVARPFQRERVAGGANGFTARTKALHGFSFGVPDMPFLFVASRAAIGRHRPHFVGGRSVALYAFDLFTDDVNAMSRHVTRKAPGLADVNACAPLAVQRR